MLGRPWPNQRRLLAVLSFEHHADIRSDKGGAHEQIGATPSG
jgi:hypothetical protein